MDASSARLLFIGGWHLLGGLNHRTRHMAAYFETRFASIDEVGFTRFYGGPPASPWSKAHRGLANLRNSRIQVRAEGSVRLITIRDLYVPKAIEMPVKDLWRYLNLLQIIKAPYDLAIFGYPGNAWLASLLKQSGRVRRLVYDDWDYHPGLERNSLKRRLVEDRERLCVRHADAVITVNSLLADLRTQQGAKQVMVVPNGVDLSLFAQARQRTPHPPTLMYMGSISQAWGIDLVIRAMPDLLRAIPDARLLIAGYGPAEAALKSLSRSLNLTEHVVFLGQFKYQDLPSLLAQADVGIATSLPTDSFRYYATPLKVVEYMAAGLPVIASRLGQTEIMMQESNAGLLIGHSEAELVQAACSLLTDPVLYDSCSRAAITYAAKFDWDLLMNKAYQYVLSLPGSDRVPEDTHLPAVSANHLP